MFMTMKQKLRIFAFEKHFLVVSRLINHFFRFQMKLLFQTVIFTFIFFLTF